MSYPGYAYNLGSVTATGFGVAVTNNVILPVNFWIKLSGVGAVSATVDILCSPDGTAANEVSILPAPIALSGNVLYEQFSERVTPQATIGLT